MYRLDKIRYFNPHITLINNTYYRIKTIIIITYLRKLVEKCHATNKNNPSYR